MPTPKKYVNPRGLVTYRVWLGREDLIPFDSPAGQVRVSSIFNWFKADFTGEGELAAVLAK